MPIIDVTGYGQQEVTVMVNIRTAIQEAFQKRWGFEHLDTTTVNFMPDPSILPSFDVHAMARVYTKKFCDMDTEEIKEVCWEVQRILEKHGKHTFNEAFAPGFPDVMCGGWQEGYRTN